ncbi:UDP-N-acetylmuramoyl-L-alanine--D-glutamate ligase [Anaerobacillus isosaccharinicus]|uniref:UDP-N-acetylmuramoylalanine--D-glutamate ligase n=1 Tax=Anaerobacillus isosaccharinicus TaxID=1532552 RepID=A0A1S2M9T3_9BACI|nr:UDP-N-acetylmuramoyl-L-alanine--D-glutamate ligase [Anaerobacillus isosaccharinicus]MBA5587439.1 UDP-N-acetylmuramoyl-L-alanine--D-glutamate ligase [Anaerobacillus isosaccharinicus]QOY34374.1 UDP-N-acetylmuramoyl-L-alanine--D-glutamate ligase [Anaerobacillus isosaccharinicus]
MKNVDYFKGKKIVVLGLAKSGLAAGTLLHKLGAQVVVNDLKPLAENIQALELQQLGVEVICGGHPLEILDGKIDLVVKNPGIPYSNPLIQKAIEKDIPVVTELEIASIISEAEMIGITGSNGKTTTTTLIYEMLKESKRVPLIAGNIGTVACEVAEKATEENILVTEVSSFQLMGTEHFHPKIAVFLNLFDAHLDYHGTRKEYGLAKAKIFRNLTTDDYCVINEDDAEVMMLAKEVIGQKVTFSVKKQVENGAYVKDGYVYYLDEKIISIENIVLPGAHNLENIVAAICAAKLAGATTKRIVEVLSTFAGVKHRTQFVTAINDRKFYNDSKATNMLATKVAVSAFDQPVILLAGGLDRGNEFDELIPTLEKVKGVVLYGETAPKLEKAAQKAGLTFIEIVNNVTEAVNKAYEHSDRGDVILLSPACASWDQFKTFEERGENFIEAISKLE